MTTIASRIFGKTIVSALALGSGSSNNYLITTFSTSSKNTMMSPGLRELTLQCSDGMVIAAQQWCVKANPLDDSNEEGETRTKNILCLHGWLDNCRSFHHLAPELANKLSGKHTDGIQVTNTDVNVVAIDFLGHGLSSHKSLDGPSILLSESAFYVAEAIEKLGWWKEDSNKRKKNEDGSAEPVRQDNIPFILVGHSMGAAGMISWFYACIFIFFCFQFTHYNHYLIFCCYAWQ